MRRGAVVLINSEIVDDDSFLALIFWNRRDLVDAAKKILRLIAKGRVGPANWKEIVDELGIPHNRYYRILRRLRAVGIVEKGEYGYRLSSDFSRRMRKLAEFWDMYRKEIEQEALGIGLDDLIMRIEALGLSKRSLGVITNVMQNIGRERMMKLIAAQNDGSLKREATSLALEAGYSIAIAEWFGSVISRALNDEAL